MGADKKSTTAYGRDFSINDVEILDNTESYDGFLSVVRIVLRHRLYEGGWSGRIEREVVRRAPGIGVLLYDPDLDKVLMVEQFRVGCLDDPKSPWQLELVAGLIDTDETPEDVAIREAKEEADADINWLIPVCEYYNSPGTSSEKSRIFCAAIDADREEGIFGLDKENEDIRTVLLTREEALKGVSEGSINNAMSVIALQWLNLNLDTVKTELANSRT